MTDAPPPATDLPRAPGTVGRLLLFLGWITLPVALLGGLLLAAGGGAALLLLPGALADIWAGRGILRLRRSARNVAIGTSLIWIGILIAAVVNARDTAGFVYFAVLILRIRVVYSLVKYRRWFDAP